MFYNTLQTERLTLKNISKEDRDFVYKQFSDDVINRYLFDAEPLTNLEGADEIIDFYVQPEPRMQHRWILVHKTDGVKIGTCGFHNWNQMASSVEIGYDLQEAYWGKGYMKEAMKEIIAFAQTQMQVREIQACISVENEKSIKLVEQLGFEVSGSKYEVFRDQDYLHHIYTLRL